tara:strand:+ start:125 stop:391 length:267 start_codon:yes stop_codon:yes gene_type:complete
MEFSKSEDLSVQLTKATDVASYISDWRDTGTVTLRDTNAETGVRHELELKFPLAVLRELSESLVKHIVEFDEAKAKKEAEEKAEESVE